MADVRSKAVAPFLLGSVSTSYVSGGLVVEADVQSIVVAQLLLGSVVCTIATSYMSAELLVLACSFKMGGALLLNSFVCVIATSCVSAGLLV